MIKSIKYIIACLAAFLPAILLGCDLCGSYVGVMPMDNQNSFSIVHRFRVYNGYRSMDQNGMILPAGAYRYAQPPSPLHGGSHGDEQMSAKDFESFKLIELRGRYFIHDRVQLDFVFPIVNNKAKSMGNTADVWGVGDISFCMGYRLLQSPEERSFRQRLIIGLGVKLPTGSSKSTFTDGDRLPVMMQPGTGSYDYFGMVSYAFSFKTWAVSFTTHNRYSKQNSFHEQIMPVTNNTLVLAKCIEKNSWKFYPQLQVYQEFTQGVRENGYLISGTRMNNYLIGPGLEVYKGKIGFSSCVQLPVHQYVYEMNMEMTWRLTVGISYSFSAEKYIFQ